MHIPWKVIGTAIIKLVVPATAGAVNPVLGVIMNGIISGVLDSAAKPDLNNDQKKDNAMTFVAGAVGDIEKSIKDAGLKLHDPTRFNAGVDTVMEGLIDILKATAAIPKNPSTTVATQDYLPAQVLVTQTPEGVMTISIKPPNV